MFKPLEMCALATGAALSPLVCTGALAQAATEESVLETIIVTAQKREQSLEDVPISIQVIDQDFIEKSDIRSLEDYVDLVPSITIEPGRIAGGGATVRIRGVGRLAGNTDTYALYVDGFDVTGASSSQAGARLVDAERIEVLRGPQGTAFGRNTVAGAINITSQTPDLEEIFGQLAIDAGSDSTYGVQGRLNLPVNQTTALLLSAYYDNTDGHVRNIGPSGGSNSEENFGGRVGFYSEPTDRLSIKASLSYEKVKQGLTGALPDGNIAATTQALADLIIDPGLNPDVPPGTFNPTLTRFFPDQNDTVALDTPENSESDTLTAILRFDYDFDDMSLISVSGYTHQDFENQTDTDFSDLNSTFEISERSREFYSTELRLQSTGGNRLEWVAGVFGAKSRSERRTDLIAGDLLRASTFIPFFGAGVLPFPQDAAFFPDGRVFIVNAAPGTAYEVDDETLEGTSVAVFADIDYAVTERLNILLGGRYNYDEFEQTIVDLVDLNALPEVSLPAIGPLFVPLEFPDATDTVDSDKFTWRVSAVFATTDNINSYATISTGYRPGGLQLGNVQVVRNADGSIGTDLSGVTFTPETMINYEVGAKVFFFNRRLNINTAAFFMDYDDIQFVVRDQFTAETTTGNAAAEIYGLEFDVLAEPIDGLVFNASLSYTETEVTDISGGAPNDPRVGQPLPYAPEISASFTADYQRPLFGEIEGFGRITFSYTGKRNDQLLAPDDDNQVVLASYSLVDLRFGLTKPDRWRLEGYVDNATDKIYATSVFVSGLSATGDLFISPPGRQFGARLIAQF